MFNIVMFVIVGILGLLLLSWGLLAILLPVYLLVRLWDLFHAPSAEELAEIERLLAEP